MKQYMFNNLLEQINDNNFTTDNIIKHLNNIDLETQIIIVSNTIQSIYNTKSLDEHNNSDLLKKLSDLLILKSTEFIKNNNNNCEQIKKILNLNNDFNIVIMEFNDFIFNLDDIELKRDLNNYHKYLKNSYIINDFINIGRHNDALKLFNFFHKYGKCNYNCGCSSDLLKIQKWKDYILFYNKYENDELLQTESFIYIAEQINKNNLITSEKKIELSNLIEDTTNKVIFIKKINGENITPAYKFGLGYENHRKED